MIENTNPETGVRYGIVALNSLADWVFDEFFHKGKNLTADACFEESGIDPDDDEKVQEFWDGYCGEEECYELDTHHIDGLRLQLTYLGGAAMVWVFESPHKTHARLCSPCVPNCGDLDSQDAGGFECYTLPVEWFAEDLAETTT